MNALKALFRRTQIEVEDALKYHPAVRELLAGYCLARDHFAPVRDNMDLAWSLNRLAAAGRFARRPGTLDTVYRRVEQRLNQLDLRAIDWPQLVPSVKHRAMHTSVILKPPVGPREKGVLYLSFEREWVKLLHHADPAELARDWIVVLAPSNSPHNVPNYVFPRAYPGTVVTQISNPGDLAELPRISSRWHVVPLYASSWIRPEVFQPRPHSERDIDLIMVANFAKVKRHFALFRALRHLPRSWRVHLIGQAQDGRTGATARELAGLYGVADRFTLQSDATHEQVVEAFGRSKTSVILSRREGSCVVVAESLFADTPAALMRGALIGSRTFLNERTGRFLTDGNLAGQLIDFHAASSNYAPRAWALENITCQRSSRVLNEFLRRLSLDQGQEWSQDIFTMCWRPDPRLVDPADRKRIEPARQALKARWGLEIGPDE